MRLIDADEVKRQIDEWLDIVGYCTIGKGLSYYGELLGCIEDAPTIEASPVVHGEWMQTVEDIGMDLIHCSCCKKRWNIFDNDTQTFNFCPNCGARMDGKKV